MTRLFNDPADFPTELLEGFAAAYPDIVMAVPGGVVRSTRYDEVAVIAGGGSGHYPAFCGLVGEGVAHAAVVGNLFSSPSAQQAYTVAKAADRGHGVVFSFGNYAGDVLHFGEAAERLRTEGVRAEVLLVTDDIASAPPEQLEKRRGIAGDLVAFKIAGAAAARGADLDEVMRLGRLANERTRTLGVAFAGCTLPGASEPLFTVPEGMMSVGLGIHGEPGIADVPIPTADELAELFVERLLADVPADRGNRAAVLLNGLGSVKYEELFVVYRRVQQLLAEAGITVVSPDVGELCTSLDMAGASLTLFWLTDELELLWTTPSAAAGYRRGAAATAEPVDEETRRRVSELPTLEAVELLEGSAASRRLAEGVLTALAVAATTMAEHADELGRIDAVAGDGDHGIGMERGTRAALEAGRAAFARGAGAGSTLTAAGAAWSDKAGGTSGALWGAALKAAGARLGDADGADDAVVIEALVAAVDRIVGMGGARVGDKTMVDALMPFRDRLLAASDGTAHERLAEAAAEAERAAEATRSLRPLIGRARPLAEKSLGTPDAGAVSAAVLIRSVLDAFLPPEETSHDHSTAPHRDRLG